ncbi:MAG: hypothetical protein F4123_08235 [Gemmatimonadetes bacterium]|nr:hypothetical protein [Gemmatimonadota bacterium]MYB98230.1 hypothetical protein [Gemmatimonadota bacterium]MYI46344.1 hypothetical protein [Gemmatimonadota bacterium]
MQMLLGIVILIALSLQVEDRGSQIDHPRNENPGQERSSAESIAAADTGQLRFEEAPEGPLFGPTIWAQGKMASFHIECYRYSRHIQPDPDGLRLSFLLAPRELAVAFVWHKPASEVPPVTIAGTSSDPMDRVESDISFRKDASRVWTEQWVAHHGFMQEVRSDSAVAFLARLLSSGTHLTVFAEFSDGQVRTQTFDVSGVRELLTRMEPKCAAVRPLLEL